MSHFVASLQIVSESNSKYSVATATATTSSSSRIGQWTTGARQLNSWWAPTRTTAKIGSKCLHSPAFSGSSQKRSPPSSCECPSGAFRLSVVLVVEDRYCRCAPPSFPQFFSRLFKSIFSFAEWGASCSSRDLAIYLYPSLWGRLVIFPIRIYSLPLPTLRHVPASAVVGRCRQDFKEVPKRRSERSSPRRRDGIAHLTRRPLVPSRKETAQSSSTAESLETDRSSKRRGKRRDR